MYWAWPTAVACSASGTVHDLEQATSSRTSKKHKTSKAELDALRGGVAVKLQDAKSTAISDDTRFATAYGAALTKNHSQLARRR